MPPAAAAGPSNPSLPTGRIRDTDDVARATGLTQREQDEEEEISGGGVGKNKRFRKDKRQLFCLTDDDNIRS